MPCPLTTQQRTNQKKITLNEGNQLCIKIISYQPHLSKAATFNDQLKA